jgi:hypothetical protein
VYREVWSDNVHLIKDFDATGANVQDTHENWYPTKDVLPTDTEIPEAAMEQGAAPVEQEAVEEPQPPTPMSRPSSAAAAPSDRRREMIRRWKAFYERGLPAGVRAAGVEQMKPSDNELRQARRDLAENAERIARKGPTQPRLDLQRRIEARIAELEKPRVIGDPSPRIDPPRPFANVPVEELQTRLQNARQDEAMQDHPRRLQEVRALIRQYEEELQRRPPAPPRQEVQELRDLIRQFVRPPAPPAAAPAPPAAAPMGPPAMPPFPVKNDTEVFLRQLVTGSIRDEEHLEEARKQLKQINRIRADINRSDAPDKDQKGSSLDRWHELLRRRMAEKEGGVALGGIPIRLTKGGSYKTMLAEQLTKDLETRGIRDEEENEKVRKRIQADAQRVMVLQKQIKELETLQPPEYEQKVAGLKAQLDKVKSRLEFLRGKHRTCMRQ